MPTWILSPHHHLVFVACRGHPIVFTRVHHDLSCSLRNPFGNPGLFFLCPHRARRFLSWRKSHNWRPFFFGWDVFTVFNNPFMMLEIRILIDSGETQQTNKKKNACITVSDTALRLRRESGPRGTSDVCFRCRRKERKWPDDVCVLAYLMFSSICLNM